MDERTVVVRIAQINGWRITSKNQCAILQSGIRIRSTSECSCIQVSVARVTTTISRNNSVGCIRRGRVRCDREGYITRVVE